MVRQTQMNGKRAVESPVRVAARSAAGLWHHILTLVELQMRLVGKELSDVLSRAGIAAGLIVVGGVIALTAMPIVLIAVAFALVEALDLSPAGAFALTALLAYFVAAGLVFAGWRQLRKGVDLPRSREEWRLNWNWLKTTLREESTQAKRNERPGEREA
jgi:hypothetical protein